MSELDLRDAEIARLHQQPKDTHGATIERLKQELKNTRDELDVYRLASERAIYDAQQFDATLYLNTDRGVEDVMRRVLARLAEYEGADKRWHSFETMQAIVKERDQLLAELNTANSKAIQAQADARVLVEALAEAGLTLADWGNYADDYSQEKYGLEDDLKAIGKVLSEYAQYLEAQP